MMFRHCGEPIARFFIGLFLLLFLILTILVSQSVGGKFFAVAVVIGVTGAAVDEYCQLVKTKGFSPSRLTGLLVSFFFPITLFLTTQIHCAYFLPPLVLGLALLFLFAIYSLGGSEPLTNLALSFFPYIYIVVPLSFLLAILYFPFEAGQDGRIWISYLFAMTIATDIGGLYIGKLLGKRKLAPYISPQKTWEGALGGALAALITSLCFYQFSSMNLSLLQNIVLSLLLTFLAGWGDLVESLLKRDVGVKDSAHLPGLGGIMDIIDSLLLTTPLYYLFLLSRGSIC